MKVDAATKLEGVLRLTLKNKETSAKVFNLTRRSLFAVLMKQIMQYTTIGSA
jgi:hypothetical protein